MAGATSTMSNISFRSRVANCKCLIRPRARVCARSQRLNVQAVRPFPCTFNHLQMCQSPRCIWDGSVLFSHLVGSVFDVAKRKSTMP